jgi:broad specificity phosphatase PhoE
MAELIVVRHGQAAFGQDNYDQLSDVGHRQSKLAGKALADMGWVPDRLITGTLTRQRDTLSSMGFDTNHEEHAGFNEYDFHNLLQTRFPDGVPDLVIGDRKVHFRTLRETILDWQGGGLDGASESWKDFSARVAAALVFATNTDARRVLVVSSGGPIGQLTARSLNAPDPMMMELNLQVKNTSFTKFIFSKGRVLLQGFNATPHLDVSDNAHLLTYS